MSADIPLFLFAKAPIPGKVKTRLQSHCSAEQAAKIACILLEESIRTVTKYWPGKLYLSVWLDSEHSFFERMQQQYSIELVLQCDGDLGAKMQNALARLGYPAVVMGCDAPHTSEQTLQAAYQGLLDGQSVIGPSEDGGYYLLGLNEPADFLFKGVAWGQESVLAQTLASAKQHQLELLQLDALNDVDEWRDLVKVADLLPALMEYLVGERLV